MVEPHMLVRYRRIRAMKMMDGMTRAKPPANL
jgi:hypothetical protein